MYKAIIFDWDGTLVHHSALIAEGHNHVRKHFGLEEYDRNAAISRGHQSTRELYPILYGDKAAEAEQLFYDYFFDNHLSDVKPFDDTLAMLDLMVECGVAGGVVSNKRDVFLKREIDHIQWTKYFPAIIGAGVAEADKPSAAPIILAAQTIASTLTPQDILYVGDTETDMKAAQNMGCHFMLCTRGRDMNDFIAAHNPQYVSDGFEEIEKILEKSNNQQNKKKA